MTKYSFIELKQDCDKIFGIAENKVTQAVLEHNETSVQVLDTFFPDKVEEEQNKFKQNQEFKLIQQSSFLTELVDEISQQYHESGIEQTSTQRQINMQSLKEKEQKRKENQTSDKADNLGGRNFETSQTLTTEMGEQEDEEDIENATTLRSSFLKTMEDGTTKQKNVEKYKSYRDVKGFKDSPNNPANAKHQVIYSFIQDIYKKDQSEKLNQTLQRERKEKEKQKKRGGEQFVSSLQQQEDIINNNSKKMKGNYIAEQIVDEVSEGDSYEAQLQISNEVFEYIQSAGPSVLSVTYEDLQREKKKKTTAMKNYENFDTKLAEYYKDPTQKENNDQKDKNLNQQQINEEEEEEEINLNLQIAKNQSQQNLQMLNKVQQLPQTEAVDIEKTDKAYYEFKMEKAQYFHDQDLFEYGPEDQYDDEVDSESSYDDEDDIDSSDDDDEDDDEDEDGENNENEDENQSNEDESDEDKENSMSNDHSNSRNSIDSSYQNNVYDGHEFIKEEKVKKSKKKQKKKSQIQKNVSGYSQNSSQINNSQKNKEQIGQKVKLPQLNMNQNQENNFLTFLNLQEVIFQPINKKQNQKKQNIQNNQDLIIQEKNNQTQMNDKESVYQQSNSKFPSYKFKKQQIYIAPIPEKKCIKIMGRNMALYKENNWQTLHQFLRRNEVLRKVDKIIEAYQKEIDITQPISPFQQHSCRSLYIQKKPRTVAQFNKKNRSATNEYYLNKYQN